MQSACADTYFGLILHYLVHPLEQLLHKEFAPMDAKLVKPLLLVYKTGL